MSYEILGIGAPVVDLILQVSEEELRALNAQKGGMEVVTAQTILDLIARSGEQPRLIAGGSSSNTIKGLANLGRKCALAGKIGDDPYGKKFLKAISDLKIHTLHHKSQTPTGQVLCLITPDGERTFRCFLGASGELQPSDLKEEMFRVVKLVHIEGYSLLTPGLTERAMLLAKEAGAKISFDLASFDVVKQHRERIVMLAARYVDVLFANEAETRYLTGLGAEKGCSVLRDLCETVAVLMGERGCIVGDAFRQVQCPAYPVEPVDTTGAGDLFASGFLDGYLKGLTLEECAHQGAVMGNLVVQVFGAEIPHESWERVRASFTRPTSF